MGVIKKIVHILANLVYILIALYGIFCIPIIFKYIPVVVLSGSMEPTYDVGSVIYYKKVSFDELKVNDVITYKQGDNLVSHRIVNINNGLITTKGDNNKSEDALKVTSKDVVGKNMDIVIPYIGYYIKFINENYMIFIVATLIILVSEFLMSNLKIFDKYKGKVDVENEKNQ